MCSNFVLNDSKYLKNIDPWMWCCQGLRLEICTGDRVGLLTDVTRKFREYGMSVTKADVSTQGNMAVNIFYVTDNEGQPVDTKTVDAMRREDPIFRGVKAVVSKVNTNTNTSAGASRDVVDGASRFSNFMQSTERFFQGFTTSWKTPTVVWYVTPSAASRTLYLLGTYSRSSEWFSRHHLISVFLKSLKL